MHRLRPHGVIVVEYQHHRLAERQQGRHQGIGDIRRWRECRYGEQRLDLRTEAGSDGVQGGNEVPQKALQVAVLCVQGEPRRPPGQVLEPLGRKDRLAEAGRGRDQRDALLEAGIQAGEEPRAQHIVGTGPGAMQLRWQHDSLERPVLHGVMPSLMSF